MSLVVYMLLAAILTFGQMLYSAQTLQQAADVAAREISRTPLSATANVMDVLYSSQASDYSNGPSTVRTALFDPQLLQFDLTTAFLRASRSSMSSRPGPSSIKCCTRR